MDVKRNSKKNKKKKIIIAIAIYYVVVILVIFVILQVKKSSRDNKNNENVNLQEKLSGYVEETISEDNNKKEYKVDFKSLKAINSDTVGIIKVGGTNIEYAVVKGNDNSYYMNHNFEKESNETGWIFADYSNIFNHTDYNLVIYGYNTESDNMFGPLDDVLKKEWDTNGEDKYITLITDETTGKYKVFSAYKEKSKDNPKIDFNSDAEYLNYLNEVKSKSVKDFNIVPNGSSGIISLVAYDNGGTEKIIVHAVRVI